MAGQFGAPQEGRAIGNFLLRSAAVAVEREGVAIAPRRFRPVAGLDLEQREMPAEMTVEEAVARIGGEPPMKERTARLELAALVADVCEAMRAMRIVAAGGQRLLDLHPGRPELPILRQGHGVLGDGPEVVDVVR